MLEIPRIFNMLYFALAVDVTTIGGDISGDCKGIDSATTIPYQHPLSIPFNHPTICLMGIIVGMIAYCFFVLGAVVLLTQAAASAVTVLEWILNVCSLSLQIALAILNSLAGCFMTIQYLLFCTEGGGVGNPATSHSP